MSEAENFIIVNNELQKYVGTDVNVVIPDGITSIASEAFYTCGQMSPLESVVIPETVTRIGSNAFQNCYNLVKVVMPDSVNYIGCRAFRSCYNVREIKIPKALTNIEEATFCGCDALDIEIPEGIVKIGASAFQYAGLTKLVIPKSLMSVGVQAFEGCKMERVEILGDTQFEYWSRVFSNCSNFTEFIVSDDHPTYKVIDGCLCAKDGKTLFCIPSGKKTLYISYGVETIGECACWQTTIEEITFPETLKTIGKQAFYRCNGLKEVIIPGNVKDIQREALSSNTLTKIVLEEGVETIGDFAIGGMFDRIVIPSTVKRIGNGAIGGTSKGLFVDLSHVSADIQIDPMAFQAQGTPYVYLSIPKSLGYTPRYGSAIFCDSKLENVSYNDVCMISLFPLEILPTKKHQKIAIYDYVLQLKRWNSYTKEFKSERDAYLTESYKDWMDDALENPLLMAYFVEKKILPVDEALAILDGGIEKEEIRELLLDYTRSKKCKAYKKVKKGFTALPDNTTSIGCYAFYQNSDNVDFVMPDSVVSVGTSAFAVNNNLSSVSFGANLKYIGNDAFVSCDKLQTLKFNGTMEQWKTVYKGECWNMHVPANKVVCLDGEVELEKSIIIQQERTLDNCASY